MLASRWEQDSPPLALDSKLNFGTVTCYIISLPIGQPPVCSNNTTLDVYA